MTQAKKGDRVAVDYVATLHDGTVIDQPEAPVELLLGKKGLLPDFEQALVGMEPGQSKRILIPSKRAFGDRRDDMLLVIDPDQLPLDIQVGQKLRLSRKKSRPVIVQVAEITDTSVILDANHPLAGQDLIYEIRLVAIK